MAALGGKVRQLYLVGCEPATAAAMDDMQMGLSEPVRAAVDEAVMLVESLAARLLTTGSSTVNVPLSPALGERGWGEGEH